MSDGPPVPRWARAAAVLLGAALYALALPPWDWAWLGWVALVPLLVVVRPLPVGQAFTYGVLYGCACPWAIGPWLAQAMGRYFALGLPLGVVAASLYAVVFWGAAFGLFSAGAVILLRPERSLAARLAGAAEAVEEGTSGVFVDEPTIENLAEALGRFLRGEIRFDRQACRNFAHRFTWRKVVDHALQYYREPH